MLRRHPRDQMDAHQYQLSGAFQCPIARNPSRSADAPTAERFRERPLGAAQAPAVVAGIVSPCFPLCRASLY
jgi:hypothetical protein